MQTYRESTLSLYVFLRVKCQYFLSGKCQCLDAAWEYFVYIGAFVLNLGTFLGVCEYLCLSLCPRVWLCLSVCVCGSVSVVVCRCGCVGFGCLSVRGSACVSVSVSVCG